MDNRYVVYLATLKTNEGLEGFIPMASPEKLALRRKWAKRRVGCKLTKDRCAELLSITHQPNQVEEATPRDEAT